MCICACVRACVFEFVCMRESVCLYVRVYEGECVTVGDSVCGGIFEKSYK